MQCGRGDFQRDRAIRRGHRIRLQNNPFVLPQGFRPKKTVRVPVDPCNAANGRLEIDKNGSVYIDTEKDFSAAACFTSLESRSCNSRA